MIPFIPHWISDHFRIKLGLFFLAVMLWFLVVTEKTFEYAFEIPIVAVSVVEGKMITNPTPKYALVKFQANGKEMLQMQFFNQPYLEINLSTIRYKYNFGLRPDMVILPNVQEASVIEIIHPDSILFLLDDIEQLTLPIQPLINISPSSGYTRSREIKLDPTEVKLSGPKIKLQEIQEIFTDSVDLIDVKRNTELILNLQYPEIYGIEIVPMQVKALIYVERIGERTVKGVPVLVRNPPENRTILVEPGSVDIAITGAVSMLGKLKKDDFKVWIDYRDYNPRRSNRVPVRINLESEVTIVKVTPEDVRLIVRHQ